jgi:hypothetical protein
MLCAVVRRLSRQGTRDHHVYTGTNPPHEGVRVCTKEGGRMTERRGQQEDMTHGLSLQKNMNGLWCGPSGRHSVNSAVTRIVRQHAYDHHAQICIAVTVKAP